MRNILVDYARTRDREKRGHGIEHLALSAAPLITVEKSVELLAALHKLEQQDVRKSQVVELRYFGGS